MTLRSAVERRRSWPKVTDAAPTHDELLPLVQAAASVADHGSLRPWRLIELRGDARERLGVALAAAAGLEGSAAEKLAAKPLRAPLLIAIVACRKPSHKVPHWEQDATAAGVGHLLSLLLDDAGWGVIWRTGGHTRSKQVRKMHHLAENEELLGWLYVGGMPEPGNVPRRGIDPEEFISAL
ncbi:nitroreductase family protein [Diaminobutyricimonas sp. LJ205]|uniref:nitroreductase family protein n=1 Tax=Diaminobutyricimonas sp. LJ205 TaxID=2683590 RepID=UPI0012F492FD|nr:nitroreductase family protein [Diaminobutyricimonas sp. LJ205]